MKSISIFVVILFSQSVFAKSEANSNDASMVCMNLYSIVASAFKYKSEGKTKKEMLMPLPLKEELNKYPENRAKSKILGLQMHAAIEDIYEIEGLSVAAYAAYRAETCYRITTSKPIHESLKSVKQGLLSCSSLTNKEQVACGLKFANPNS